MSANCYPCEPSELPTLQGFEERARATRADHDRQRARLDVLSARLEREQCIVTPAAFAALRAETEQQSLITQAAEQAATMAERELTGARLGIEKEQAEAARAQRMQEIDSELAAISDENRVLQGLIASVPEKFQRNQWRLSNLLRERAAL